MKQIELSQGKIALVDDEDYEFLNQFKWYAFFNKYTNSFYAARGNYKTKSTIYMHRLILNLNDRHTMADHIDHDTLNNQRFNLRCANRSQNAANSKSRLNSSSKYLGVCWDKNRNKWKAQIFKDKQMLIGRFDNEKDAAKAYDVRAKQFHGEFANLNFPYVKAYVQLLFDEQKQICS